MRLRLRPKLAVFAFTVLTILLIVGAATLLLKDFRERELEHERLESENVTRMLLGQVQETLDGVDQVLEGVQDRLYAVKRQRGGIDTLSLQRLLNARKAGVQHLESLIVIDSRGTPLASSRNFSHAPASVLDYRDLRRLSSFSSQELFIADRLYKQGGKNQSLLLARRISDAKGRFSGAVVAALEPSYFEQHFDLMNFDEPRAMALYLANGTLVASRPHRENGVLPDAQLADAISRLSTGIARLPDEKGEMSGPSVLMLGRVAGYPLAAGVTSDEHEALSYWSATARPMVLGVGLVCMLLLMASGLLIFELTREERLSRALRESNERFQRTMDSVTDAIVATGRTRHITMFNRSAERLFGLSSGEAIGRTVEVLVPEPLRERFENMIREVMESGKGAPESSRQIEFAGLRSDGSEFPVETTLSRTVHDGASQLTLVWRDVTERLRMETEQREMNRQLRDLSASLQGVREQERTRIARELHDNLGQQLTGLKLDLSWLSNRLKEGRTAPVERLDSMRSLLDDAIADVRHLSSELRPMILDDLGFGAAVAWHAGEFTRRSGIETDLDLGAAESITDPAIATALFRIVQESLTNVVRHAEATRVSIALLLEGAGLVLSVEDDGRGMPVDGPESGVGLVSMRERAAAFGGTLDYGRPPAGGTYIKVMIPLPPPHQSGEFS